MSTGYTGQIEDNTTLKEFILICARAMGALVCMRDESSDAEIPKRFEPSSIWRHTLSTGEFPLKASKTFGSRSVDENLVRIVTDMEFIVRVATNHDSFFN